MKKQKNYYLLLFAMTIAMLSLIPLFKFEAAADTQRDVYPIDTYAKLQSIASVDST